MYYLSFPLRHIEVNKYWLSVRSLVYANLIFFLKITTWKISCLQGFGYFLSRNKSCVAQVTIKILNVFEEFEKCQTHRLQCWHVERQNFHDSFPESNTTRLCGSYRYSYLYLINISVPFMYMYKVYTLPISSSTNTPNSIIQKTFSKLGRSENRT